jgi:uroporphyrinogen decarboxylase
MGDVNYMMSMYDNPRLLKDINEFYLNFVMNYWSKIFNEIEIDWVMIWEDMAFKTGSFISKEAFREFLTPYYIKLIDFLKQYKIKNIIVDCDGLVEELIPLWLEAGVTGVFPMEAVNDLVKIRKMYPKLQMLGGVDKKILIDGTGKDIDDELEMVSILMKKGGYIPHIDHSIPLDAEWNKLKEYREKLNNIIDSNDFNY